MLDQEHLSLYYSSRSAEAILPVGHCVLFGRGSKVSRKQAQQNKAKKNYEIQPLNYSPRVLPGQRPSGPPIPFRQFRLLFGHRLVGRDPDHFFVTSSNRCPRRWLRYRFCDFAGQIPLGRCGFQRNCGEAG